MALKNIIKTTLILNLIKIILSEDLNTENVNNTADFNCDCGLEKENILHLKELLDKIESEYSDTNTDINIVPAHGLLAYEPCLQCLNATEEQTSKYKSLAANMTTFGFTDPDVNSTITRKIKDSEKVQISEVAEDLALKEQQRDAGFSAGEKEADGLPGGLLGVVHKKKSSRHALQDKRRRRRHSECPAGFVRVKRHCIEKDLV